MTNPHKLDRLGAEFEQRIRSNIPEGLSVNDVLLLENGLVVAKNPDGKSLRPLGCQICMGKKYSQNILGYPVIDGTPLLNGQDLGMVPSHYGSGIGANLWVCPQCKIPVSELLPEFDTTDIK